MALTDESSGNGFYMPVAPAYSGAGNGGFGFGGDWAWILLLLVLFGGGWNNGLGGGWGGSGELYPWMNNSNQISDGFRDQMLNTTITSIRDKLTSGFGDVQNALCSGFGQAEIAANARQMADMQQMFGVQSALQQCCCDNKAGLADVKYTIATEACATRSANSANTQAILDKLCQLELDGYKREVDSLRSQLSDAKFAQSQTAQNAFIQQGLTNEVDALYNRLSSCPVPTTPVYGRTPIFTCGGNSVGCGCGA